MKIEIVKDFQPKDFIDERMKLTKLQLRRSYMLSLYMAFIGIGIILYDTLISNATSEISDCGFPIAFFLFSIFILLQARQLKRKTKLHLISLTRNPKGKTSTIITEEGISYTDMEFSVKCNWTYFTHYRLIENLIYLTGPIEIGSAFVINKSDLEAEVQSELMNFINNNLAKRNK